MWNERCKNPLGYRKTNVFSHSCIYDCEICFCHISVTSVKNKASHQLRMENGRELVRQKGHWEQPSQRMINFPGKLSRVTAQHQVPFEVRDYEKVLIANLMERIFSTICRWEVWPSLGFSQESTVSWKWEKGKIGESGRSWCIMISNVRIEKHNGMYFCIVCIRKNNVWMQHVLMNVILSNSHLHTLQKNLEQK